MSRGWDVVDASDEEELLTMVRAQAPQLIVLRCAEGTPVALTAARRIRDISRGAHIVLAAVRCPVEDTLAAMRCGINDVVADGCTDAELQDALARLAESRRACRREVEIAGAERLVGRSRAVADLRRSIERVAGTDANVLITGETGTGKELTAELIHANSRRRDRPFVSINCAAIPDSLLESELFGYERGAFTGAHAAREGKLEYARGGTLFLDEVGDMNLYAQAKILRAIESRRVQRLGGHRDIAVNIRIIAATNHNIEQLTSQQKFRQDLYFRLNVARIHLSPLRDHAEDIPDLADQIFTELSARLGRPVDTVHATYLESLLKYEWPGNIRELRNVIESTLVFCSSDRITSGDLPPYLRGLFASEERKRDTERSSILDALNASGWNRNQAARLLGCSRMTLYRKMVRYQLFAEESGGEDPCNVTARA